MTTDATTSTEAQPFKHHAVVHLFGRHTVAGLASEQKIAGKDFLRIDIPEINGRPARTILYSPDAVYDIEAVDEETARLVAAMNAPAEPLSAWSARRMVQDTASASARELGAPVHSEGQEDPLFDASGLLADEYGDEDD
jgi:hypothetical protein